MNWLDNLKKRWNISDKTVNGERQIVPGKYDKERDKLLPLKFADEMDSLYKMWLLNALDSQNTVRNRFDRYKELSYAYYNSTLFSRAVHLYADETLQDDCQNNILNIYAKNPKVETYINDFFKKIGITKGVLKDAAFDLSLYSDHFWELETAGSKGILSITPLDVHTVTDRIEYNAMRFLNDRNKFTIVTSALANKSSKIQMLTNIFDNAEIDYSSQFKSYLFGYQLNETLYLPPWNIVHFRILSHSSEFCPYGRPLLINCLSPFKQLQTSKNLMALARASNFPIKHFQVKVADSMGQMDQWEVVQAAREEYENLMGIANKEKFSTNGSIWTPKDLLDIDVKDVSIDLDKIADVEMLKADLADGTGIPADYLFSGNSSWGVSGKALLQQSKLFARSVFNIQTALLEELINLVKLQFILTGDFDEDEEFEISLNFPVEEADMDKLNSQTSALELAKGIIDSLTEITGLEGSLPYESIKLILNKFKFLSSEEIDFVLKEIDKQKQEEEKLAAKEQKVKEKEVKDEEDSFDFSFEETQRIRNVINEDVIREAYFKIKEKKNIQEGLFNRKHFVSSFKVNESGLDFYKKALIPESRQLNENE